MVTKLLQAATAGSCIDAHESYTSGDPTMSSADISRDLVETLPLTEKLREMLEITKSQILQDVEAVKAGRRSRHRI